MAFDGNEVHVAAPVGERVTFTGQVVSIKERMTQYGIRVVITVKVTTPDGTWLAWGTAPRALVRYGYEHLYGATVEITAGLERGNEAHFAFMKRPPGKLVVLAGALAA